MAIGTPTSIGSANAATASATIAMTASASVAAGQFVVVCVGGANSASEAATFSDSKSNTWATDISNNASSSLVAIGSSQITNALTTSDTITCTYSPSNETARIIAAVQISGIATSSAKDKTTSATGSALGWSTGATAATTQADEIVIAACVNDSTSTETSTPDGSYTELFDFATSSALNMTVIYLIVSATGAQTGSGTWTNSGSRTWGAAVATYKGVAAATVIPPLPFVVDFAVARASNY